MEKAEAITKTKGGLYIPEKAQGRVVHGTIVATGPGSRNEVMISKHSLSINLPKRIRDCNFANALAMYVSLQNEHNNTLI